MNSITTMQSSSRNRAGEPRFQRLGQGLYPDVAPSTNSFVSTLVIILIVLILGLVITILVFVLNRSGSQIAKLDMIKDTLDNTVVVCLDAIKVIVTNIQTIVTTIAANVTNILTLVTNIDVNVAIALLDLDYLREKANSTMLMEDPNCSDGNVCTVDLCDSFGGCQNRPVKNSPATECHDVCRADPILLKSTAKERSEIPNGNCVNGKCVSTNTCKGDCPNETTEDCPTLVFKNDTACTVDCTNSKMCVWHCSLDVDAPWNPSTGGGTDNVWLEGDSRVDLECLSFLDTGDYFTNLYLQGSCFAVDSQVYKEPIVRRNVISTWRAICQYHFRCSAPDPVPYIPVI